MGLTNLKTLIWTKKSFRFYEPALPLLSPNLGGEGGRGGNFNPPVSFSLITQNR